MKSSAIPSVRVEPELRDQLEQVLQDGETVSSFVEASVRNSVRRRIEQAEFVARGMASLEEAKRTGHFIPAEEAIARLRAKWERMLAEHKRKPSSR